MKKEFINLFENSKNPIESDEIIEKIAKAYIQKDFFYNEIVKIGAENKTIQDYPVRDMDILYSSLFNLWKYNILDLSNINEKKKVLQDDYNDIISALKNIPDIHTYQEFCQINEKYPLIKKYGMIYPDNSWIFLSSRYMNGTRKNDINPKYRLYINTEARDLYKIVSAFIYKCYDNKLPFDLKFIKFAEDLSIRSDSIVIWADENTLFEYIKILNEMQEKRGDIISRCKKPPILTMQINDWIGFGEEPPKSSYTYYRVELLRNSIEKALIDWIIENENTVINYGKSRFSIKEYITAKSVKKGVKKTLEEFNRAPRRAPSRYGMQKDDLNNELCIKVCESIKDEVISKLKRGEKKIQYIDGTKRLTFYFQSSIEDICNMLIKSPKNKSKFFESIRNNIKTSSKQYGISSKNFAFSTKTEEMIKTKNIERE